MFLNYIGNDFGTKAYYTNRNFINTNRELRICMARKQFLLNCRCQNIFPNNIVNATLNLRNLHFYSNRVKNHMNSIVNSLEHRLRNEEIRYIHNHLDYLNKNLEFQKTEWKKLLPVEVFQNIIEFQLNLQKINNNKKEWILNKKLANLKNTQQIHNIIQLNKHKVNLNNECHDNKEFKDPWIVNCTDAHIPDNVNDVLRLGNNFSSSFLTKKKDIVFEIIKDTESNMEKIKIEKDREELRHKLLNTTSNFLNSSQNISAVDKSIAKHLKETKLFLQKKQWIIHQIYQSW